MAVWANARNALSYRNTPTKLSTSPFPVAPYSIAAERRRCIFVPKGSRPHDVLALRNAQLRNVDQLVSDSEKNGKCAAELNSAGNDPIRGEATIGGPTLPIPSIQVGRRFLVAPVPLRLKDGGAPLPDGTFPPGHQSFRGKSAGFTVL